MTERSETDESEYLTPAEAAATLHVHTRTLARLADAGELQAYYLPSGHRRYLRSDIKRLVGTTHEDVPA